MSVSVMPAYCTKYCGQTQDIVQTSISERVQRKTWDSKARLDAASIESHQPKHTGLYYIAVRGVERCFKTSCRRLRETPEGWGLAPKGLSFTRRVFRGTTRE